ncbi:MAG TPA: DUF559 domain-containing protein [Candidatus Acidoferrales bacterium]|nr:DUF559 domain-containing protein [Candidatus Acidoferrales bacterium]
MPPKKGSIRPDWVKRKISLAKLGHNVSLETRIKQSTASKKRGISVVTREKMRLTLLGKSRPAFSPTWKGNLSKAHRNKKLSEENKRKISIAVKEYIRLHPEIRTKASLFFKGRRLSESTKEKIRQRRLRQVLPTKDTLIELLLQRELSTKGIEYQKHKPILGQPDIFIEPNICIFADGSYWHMLPKVIKRDQIVNNGLTSKGYTVIRFGEEDIKNNLNACIKVILNKISDIKIKEI